MVFTPDGKYLITAGDDGRVLRWSLANLSSRPVEMFKQEEALFDIDVSPQGDRLFFVGFDSRLHIISLDTGKLEAERFCHCVDMRTLAISPNGQHVAAGCRNGTIHIWSKPDWQSNGVFKTHTRRVRALTFSRNGEWLISAGEDRSIMVTDIEHGKEVMRLSSGPAKVLSLAICGDNLLASGGSDNLIRLWDLEKRTQLGRLDGHTGSVASLASNVETLVSGSFDTTVRVWQLQETLRALQARRNQQDNSSVR